MLTVTPLTNAEYVLGSVALGIDEYYAGVGEAPGVWLGRWAPALGVAGMVEAEALRALIDGNDPTTGAPLLVGLRARTVKAFDLTFSMPKGASMLWALGSEQIAEVVMGAHREVAGTAIVLASVDAGGPERRRGAAAARLRLGITRVHDHVRRSGRS